jgi:S1-C subfamily serine protease
MKYKLLLTLICLVATGCTTIRPLPIPELTQVNNNFDNISIGESKATFALTKIVQDIERGKKVMSFPNTGTYAGDGAYCNYAGSTEYTYVGGKKMLGNWSTELGDVFYDELTNLGYSIAGNPSDMFNQQNSVSSAEYLIGGRIVELRGNYCHKHHWWDGRPLNTYSGETYLKIEWSVLNTLTKDVIINKTTEGYGFQEEPIVDGVYSSFRQAFSDATEKLAVDDSLKNIAIGNQIESNAEQENKYALIKVKQGPKKDGFSIEEILPHVVTIRIGQGHGSGVMIGNDGYIITNAHVVGDAKSVQIITSLGLEVEGKVISVNKNRDVALVKTPIKIRKTVTINNELPTVGSDMFAVGSPLKEELSMTVTKGIASAVRTDSASGNIFIQGDVAISPGNSGGPLFDYKGNIIGLSVAKYSGNNSSGLNLFIPIRSAFESINIELVE